MAIKLEKLILAYFNLLYSTNMYGSNEPTIANTKKGKEGKRKGGSKKEKNKGLSGSVSYTHLRAHETVY